MKINVFKNKAYNPLDSRICKIDNELVNYNFCSPTDEIYTDNLIFLGKGTINSLGGFEYNSKEILYFWKINPKFKRKIEEEEDIYKDE